MIVLQTKRKRQIETMAIKDVQESESPWQPFEPLAVSAQEIESKFGPEWLALQRFFPRLVNHMVGAAHETASSLEECKLQIKEQLPVSLEEVLPFVVRTLWNSGITSGGLDFETVLSDYYSCLLSIHGSLPWSAEQLCLAAEEILFVGASTI